MLKHKHALYFWVDDRFWFGSWSSPRPRPFYSLLNFLDTNVVLSALLWRGPPYRLLEVIRHHDEIQLFTSTALIEELADVLTRPSASKQLSPIGKTGQEVLARYVESAEVVEPAQAPRGCHHWRSDTLIAMETGA